MHHRCVAVEVAASTCDGLRRLPIVSYCSERLLHSAVDIKSRPLPSTAFHCLPLPSTALISLVR